MKVRLGAILSGALLSLAGIASASEGPLRTTGWLARGLKNPEVRLTGVSVNPGVGACGHIPGASNAVWRSDLVDPGRRDIAGCEPLQRLLREAAVNDGSTVVLYGDTNNWFATPAARGHDAYGVEKLKLFDGERNPWATEGHEPATSHRPATAGDRTPAEADPTLRAGIGDMVAPYLVYAVEDPWR